MMYVIAGSGQAQTELERAVGEMGLSDRVVITGYVDPAELLDHYRMADFFILASDGEGLGIVLLEAQACGVPTIASTLDGGAEAVEGMGWAIDPFSATGIAQAVDQALAAPRTRPRGLERFGTEAFDSRMNDAVGRLLAEQPV